MEQAPRFFAWLRRLANLEVGRFLRPTRGRIAAAGSILATLTLTFVLGAAAMYFRLPTSVSLTKAFMGAEDWAANGHDPSTNADSPYSDVPKVKLDRKGAACAGYTLCLSDLGPSANLINMRGDIVHRWKANSRMAWPRAAHVQDPLPDESVHWENGHVYPDGSLLALCGRGGDAYGYALIKLDKDSKLLWAYSANVHHALNVGEDGRIYILTFTPDVPSPPGLAGVGKTFRGEDLVILSPIGQLLATIPLYEAFSRSDFATLFETQLQRSGIQPDIGDGIPGDVLHANSIRILPRALAEKFPQFKPGWALLSFRTTSIIAAIDPDQRRVGWAAIGPWKVQHDASFLANGHLLLFDNQGAGSKMPRILEYDPFSQSIPWAFNTEDFPRQTKATFGGACQRLPNGNTLICDWHRGVIEVTPDKKVVWESTVPGHIRSKRYLAEELPFLPAGSTLR